MRCPGASLAVLGAALLLVSGAPRAQPAREALVIGNGTYSAALPPLSACLQSSHAVSAALRRVGFHVVEREDVSAGGADAAIGEFAQGLAAAPGGAAVVYSCGYVTSFNDRSFLLPVSASITRPADILTQGILVKTLLDVIPGSAGASVVAVDAVPTPDAPATLHFDVLIQPSLPDSLGVIVASQPKLPEAPTPLSSALVAGLQAPHVQTSPLLAGLQRQLGANSALTLSVVHPPAASGYLVGGPPPAPPPATAVVPPTTAVTPPAAAIAPPPSSPPPTSPADEQMTDADRRQVQIALARLGYYDGRIDGIFGADSRAAIRRYQHELGTEMTGRLTAEQTGRLVAGQ